MRMFDPPLWTKYAPAVMGHRSLPCLNRFSLLVVSVLLANSWSAAFAAPRGTLRGPEGFTYAGAEIDRYGNGFIVWKDTEAGRSRLERLDAYEPTARWDFEGYVVKGARGGDEKSRILLQGVTSEGRELRLVDTAGRDLKLLWSSEGWSRAAVEGSDASISVSRDLDWWYSLQFEATTALVTAGTIGDLEPRFHWIVEVTARDPELAVLVDAAASDQGPTLALAVDGEAWLMRPDDLVPRPLARPERCASIYTLQPGGQHLWADCGSGGHALFPLSAAEGSPPLAAVRVVEAGDLRVLADGRALWIERRHGASGAMRTLVFSDDSEIRRGPDSALPAPLGTPVHLAGEQVLVLRSDRSSPHQVFTVLPVAG